MNQNNKVNLIIHFLLICHNIFTCFWIGNEEIIKLNNKKEISFILFIHGDLGK